MTTYYTHRYVHISITQVHTGLSLVLYITLEKRQLNKADTDKHIHIEHYGLDTRT